MNSALIFVLMLVSIVMLSNLAHTWLKQRKDKQSDALADKGEELEETLLKIDKLEERIRVLERIITENKFDLKKEIDAL
jgi:membrane protein implicated in regulation of membrane protease activity